MGLILVDTSIWIDHINRPVPHLTVLIGAETTVLHPFVLTEIALGNLADWQRRVDMLRRLPSAEPVSIDAVLSAVRKMSLQGSGLGFVDAHLLAWATASPGRQLWSRDRRLRQRAEVAAVAWQPT